MTITAVDDVDEAADGGTLRKKLEEAIEVNRKLTQQLHAREVKDLLGVHGHVSEDDLKDVPLDKLEETATALQTERQSMIRKGMEATLKARGLSDSEIDDWFKQAGQSSEAEQVEAAHGRASIVRSLPGDPAGNPPPADVHAGDAIRAHFEPQN